MDANELQNRYTAGEMVALLIGTDLMGTNLGEADLSGASLTPVNYGQLENRQEIGFRFTCRLHSADLSPSCIQL